MSDAPTPITWRELMTPDVDAARAFYADLLGWSFATFPMPGGGTYHVLSCEGRQMGGMMAWNPEEPAAWMVYVAVPDVDAAAADATATGGAVLAGPMDVPNVGRMAVVADPAGAVLTVVRWTDEPPQEPPAAVGAFRWETLNVPEIAQIEAFYAKVCGLHAAPGQTGSPHLFAGARSVADLEAPPPGAPAHWLSWVVAPGGVDAARDRVVALGGRVVADGIAVPTVGRMVVIADPTGAMIGLFEPEGA